jgi:putative nucleotidyltransferase with HDIG domain
MTSRVTPLSTPIAGLDAILGALSHALDLTEGAPRGHSTRSAAIGMRLARELHLDDEARAALYYALLLKDAGCSSNAARMSALFGSSDQIIKSQLKVVDARNRVRMAWATFRASAIGHPFAIRVRTLLGIARGGPVTRELIQIRCERGAAIAARLGFPAATCDAIRSLDEHWDGQGHPAGLRGDAIPLGARIANLAQTLDLFRRSEGVRGALRVARERRGTWFDPALVDRVCRWKSDTAWWNALDAEHGVIDTPLLARKTAGAPTIDIIAEAFADIVDAKSPYTFQHSTNVARWAVAIGEQRGASAEQRARLRRAGLLHDIGKLGVSNQILDKPGRLDDGERLVIERHPQYTFEILSQVPAFHDIAHLAATHHEKLDGSGYPWGLSAEDLDQWARVLTVADIFEALTADRPYRAGMTHAAALAILNKDRGTKLDGAALDALEAASAAEHQSKGEAIDAVA